VATPESIEGQRAARLLRVQRALNDQPEPNRAERRAAAKRAHRTKPRRTAGR
jgi:hypothetical protein